MKIEEKRCSKNWPSKISRLNNLFKFHTIIAYQNSTGMGIGKNLALKLAKMGNVIICVDINEEANNQTGYFFIEFLSN